MKLSVDLYQLREKFGDRKAIEMAAQAGFDGIDFPYFWENEREEVLGDNYLEYAKEIRGYLDEAGIECTQAHAPFSIAYGCTFSESDPAFLRIVRSMESASVLGAKQIVVHAITVPKEVDLKSYNLEFYKSLLPYCEKFGIRIAVENLFQRTGIIVHLKGKLGSPKELNAMVEMLDSPWVMACVDIGHAALTGHEPEEFIAGMNPAYIKTLHVQDNDYIEDRHTLPFVGELDWEAITAALKGVGYTGDLVFEVAHFIRKFPDVLVPKALQLAVSVGRYLISKIEK